MSNGSFSIEDAGFSVGVNVKVTKRDKKTGAILEERRGHNRCLKMQLMGLVKWLNGEFNPTQSYLVSYDWIPRYLGLGTNSATAQTPPGITTEVSINDTRLLSELSPRIALPERNTIVNRSTQSYVQLVIVTYLPDELYQGEKIAEAGLFSGETGNNCLFRITFEPIKKDTDSVIEVNWTISVISVDSQNQPYEELDKVDLRESMNELLDRFAELYPTLSAACETLKSPAIYEYGRSDTTQTLVDQAVMEIKDRIYELKDLEPGQDIDQEVIDKVDEINGEII